MNGERAGVCLLDVLGVLDQMTPGQMADVQLSLHIAKILRERLLQNYWINFTKNGMYFRGKYEVVHIDL